MEYPLHLEFKKFALTNQVAVTDATGQLVMYMKQKAFTWKDTFTIFADAEQQRPLYMLRADRVMHFSASFLITDADGHVLGSVRRHGMRSLWKTHYEVVRDEHVVLDLREANPWVKVIDGVVGEIPLIGMILTGYLFHPAYVVTRRDGTLVMRMEKKAALLQGRFDIDKHAAMDATEEGLALLALLMLASLERARG